MTFNDKYETDLRRFGNHHPAGRRSEFSRAKAFIEDGIRGGNMQSDEAAIRRFTAMHSYITVKPRLADAVAFEHLRFFDAKNGSQQRRR